MILTHVSKSILDINVYIQYTQKQKRLLASYNLKVCAHAFTYYKKPKHEIINALMDDIDLITNMNNIINSYLM
jgi:hypothetical protein